MKQLINYINEASRNEKRKNAKAIEKMFLNGKKYNAISSFGILTANNMDSQQQTSSENKKQNSELIKYLKSNHYVVVPSRGYFAGNTENSFVVFNIELDVLKKLAGRFEQTSFFYCYPESNKLICEYWEKENTDQKYSKTKNDYVFINKTDKWTNGDDDCYTAVGKDFRFALDASVFDKVNESILNNIKSLCESKGFAYNENNIDNIFEWANFRVGYKAMTYKKYVNNITL